MAGSLAVGVIFTCFIARTCLIEWRICAAKRALYMMYLGNLHKLSTHMCYNASKGNAAMVLTREESCAQECAVGIG